MKIAMLFLSCFIISSNAFAFSSEGYDPSKEKTYVEIVVTEAAGEGKEGCLAVAEVLRNRGWSTQGFAGLLRNDRFLARQPRSVLNTARECLRIAESGSNTVRGATHFENIRAFGKPKWAHAMKEICTVGRHTFYKELSVTEK